jgi:hypothetical protein
MPFSKKILLVVGEVELEDRTVLEAPEPHLIKVISVQEIIQ